MMRHLLNRLTAPVACALMVVGTYGCVLKLPKIRNLSPADAPATTNPSSETATEGTTQSTPQASAETSAAAEAEKQRAEAEKQRAEAEKQLAKTERQRAMVDSTLANIAAVAALLDDCCKNENLLEDLYDTYPSTEFVKEYKRLRGNRTYHGFSEAELAELAAKYDDLDAKIAAAVRLPGDAYKGKDAAGVKKAISAYVAGAQKKKVLRVVLAYKDWSRTSGMGNSGGFYDNGWMQAFVVVSATKPGQAEVWMYRPRKDFLDGGKLKFDTYMPDKIANMKVENLSGR